MRKSIFLSRILALFLTFALSVPPALTGLRPGGPNPVFALRPRESGLEEPTGVTNQLEKALLSKGYPTAVTPARIGTTGLEEPGNEEKAQPTPVPSHYAPMTSGEKRFYHLNQMLAREYPHGAIVEIGPGYPSSTTNELSQLAPGARIVAIDNFVPEVVIRREHPNLELGAFILFNKEGKIAIVGEENLPDQMLSTRQRQAALDLKERLTLQALKIRKVGLAGSGKKSGRFIEENLFVGEKNDQIDFAPLSRNSFPLIEGDLNNLEASPEAMEAIRQADVVRAANVIVPHFEEGEPRTAVIGRLGKIMKPGSRLIVAYSHPTPSSPGEEAIEYIKAESGLISQNLLFDLSLETGQFGTYGVHLIPSGTGIVAAYSYSAMQNKKLHALARLFTLVENPELASRLRFYWEKPLDERNKSERALENELTAAVAARLNKAGYSASFRSGMISIPLEELVNTGMADKIPEGLVFPEPPAAGSSDVRTGLEEVKFFDGFTRQDTGEIATGLEELVREELIQPGQRRAMTALPPAANLGITRIFVHEDLHLPGKNFTGLEEVELPADPVRARTLLQEIQVKEGDVILLPTSVAAGLEDSYRPFGNKTHKTPIIVISATGLEESTPSILAALARIAKNLDGQVLRVGLEESTRWVISRDNRLSVQY